MATKKQPPAKQPPKPPHDDIVSPEVVQKYKDKFQNLKGSDADRFSAEAMNWFRTVIGKDGGRSKSKAMLAQNVYGRKSGTANTQLIGKMYFYHYKAENPGDDELNVYDEFPLVFIFSSQRTKDNNVVLYGLNLHYLTLKERQILLMELLKVKSSTRIRPNTRLKLSWDIIKAVATSRYYERAVHAYRIDRMQSRMIEVPAVDWSVAVFLSLQNWIHMERDGLSQSDYRKKIQDRARAHTRRMKAK